MFLKDLQKNNFQSGFTLIEVVLYIGIVVIVISVANIITTNVLFSEGKVMVMRETTQNIRFSMDKMSQEIRNADSIKSPSLGESDSSLTIAKEGEEITFHSENGILKIKRGANPSIALMPEEVKVAALNFSNVSHSENVPGAIRIHIKTKFNTNSDLKEYEFKEDFYTTATLR